MKFVLVIILTFLLNPSFGADEKKFTQKELDDKVKAEVDRQINMIKKKSITQLTKELLEKEQKLSQMDQKLEKKQEQIKMTEDSLLKRIEAFEEQKTKIIGCIDENKRNEAMRIKKLVETVSSMKPQKAAELLSVQDSVISVKLLGMIDPAKVAKIFNLMDKEVSARLQKQYLNMQQ